MKTTISCIFFTVTAVVTHGQTIADSVSDFSAIQGQSNWYYGFFTNPFSSGTFTLLESYTTNQYNSVGWLHGSSSPPWTFIGASNMHPAAPYASGIPTEWAVRRWQSAVSGLITISGTICMWLPKTDPEDGVTGYIIVDGAMVQSLPVTPGDLVGYPFTVDVVVTNGSLVDFALSPEGNDITDDTVFTVTIAIPQPFLSIRVSEVELCWPSPTGKVYQIQYSSALTMNNWTNLGDPLPGNGSNICIYDTVTASEGQRFYRVVTVP